MDDEAALSSTSAVAAESLPSVFTPLGGPPGLCGCLEPHFEPGADEAAHASGQFALGRPLEDLKAEQRCAVRAKNYQQADGRWVSAGPQPRGSAHIALLSRRPRELHIRLPWPTTRWGAALSVLGAMLGAAIAIVVPILLADAEALVPLSLALSPVLGFAGAVLAARALIAERQCFREVCISAQDQRYRVVCMPWWLPSGRLHRAIAWSGWVPGFQAATGPVDDLLGAEVRVEEGGDGGQTTSVVLHVARRRTRERGPAPVQRGQSKQGQVAKGGNNTWEVPTVLPHAGANEALASFDVRDKLCVAVHINAAISEPMRGGVISGYQEEVIW